MVVYLVLPGSQTARPEPLPILGRFLPWVSVGIIRVPGKLAAQVFPIPRLGGAKCSAVYIDDPVVNELFTSIASETTAVDREPLFKAAL